MQALNIGLLVVIAAACTLSQAKSKPQPVEAAPVVVAVAYQVPTLAKTDDLATCWVEIAGKSYASQEPEGLPAARLGACDVDDLPLGRRLLFRFDHEHSLATVSPAVGENEGEPVDLACSRINGWYLCEGRVSGG